MIWNKMTLLSVILCWTITLVASKPVSTPDINDASPTVPSRAASAYNYDRYLTYDEIVDRLKMLEQSHPDLMSLRVVGQSAEGRRLYLATITSKTFTRGNDGEQEEPTKEARRMPINEVVPVQPLLRKILKEQAAHSSQGNTVTSKPVIFVDGGIHAREWAAPAAALNVIEQLLKDPALTGPLEWRVFPLVNPDGYVYSMESKRKRYWRKNRNSKQSSGCAGVDLNRNFDVEWAQTNKDPCSIVYGGPKAFSEPESRAVRDSVNEVKDRAKAYLTIHSYGKYILYPYGYTRNKRAPTRSALIKMGDGMAQAIYDTYQSVYKVDQASILGAAAGGSDDWAYLKANIPYSYTLEMQPSTGRGISGFALPEKKLPQAVDEMWRAIRYLGEEIKKQFRVNKLSQVRIDSVISIQEEPKTTASPQLQEIVPDVSGTEGFPLTITGEETQVLADDILEPEPTYFSENNELVSPLEVVERTETQQAEDSSIMEEQVAESTDSSVVREEATVPSGSEDSLIVAEPIQQVASQGVGLLPEEYLQKTEPPMDFDVMEREVEKLEQNPVEPTVSQKEQTSDTMIKETPIEPQAEELVTEQTLIIEESKKPEIVSPPENQSTDAPNPQISFPTKDNNIISESSQSQTQPSDSSVNPIVADVTEDQVETNKQPIPEIEPSNTQTEEEKPITSPTSIVEEPREPVIPSPAENLAGETIDPKVSVPTKSNDVSSKIPQLETQPSETTSTVTEIKNESSDPIVEENTLPSDQVIQSLQETKQIEKQDETIPQPQQEESSAVTNDPSKESANPKVNKEVVEGIKEPLTEAPIDELELQPVPEPEQLEEIEQVNQEETIPVQSGDSISTNSDTLASNTFSEPEQLEGVDQVNLEETIPVQPVDGVLTNSDILASNTFSEQEQLEYTDQVKLGEAIPVQPVDDVLTNSDIPASNTFSEPEQLKEIEHNQGEMIPVKPVDGVLTNSDTLTSNPLSEQEQLEGTDQVKLGEAIPVQPVDSIPTNSDTLPLNPSPKIPPTKENIQQTTEVESANTQDPYQNVDLELDSQDQEQYKDPVIEVVQQQDFQEENLPELYQQVQSSSSLDPSRHSVDLLSTGGIMIGEKIVPKLQPKPVVEENLNLESDTEFTPESELQSPLETIEPQEPSPLYQSLQETGQGFIESTDTFHDLKKLESDDPEPKLRQEDLSIEDEVEDLAAVPEFLKTHEVVKISSPGGSDIPMFNMQQDERPYGERIVPISPPNSQGLSHNVALGYLSQIEDYVPIEPVEYLTVQEAYDLVQKNKNFLLIDKLKSENLARRPTFRSDVKPFPISIWCLRIRASYLCPRIS